MICIRNSFILPAVVFLGLVYLLLSTLLPSSEDSIDNDRFVTPSEIVIQNNADDYPNKGLHWSKRAESHPVESYAPIPSGQAKSIPRIQHRFPPETSWYYKERVKKQKAVKKVFKRAWDSYKKHAWMQDEVTPVSGKFRNGFSGWAATLVDSLDALVIMGMEDEFQQALKAIERIDFTTTAADEINVFETMIRYVGGFLGAYDLTNGKYPILLQKATRLADMMYCSFDTPNRMPQSRWEWTK